MPPRSRGVLCRGLSTSSALAQPQSDRGSASVDVASTPAGKRRGRWSRSPSRQTGCERSRRRSKIFSWNSAISCHLSRRPDCPACQVEEIAQHSDFSHRYYVTRAVPCMHGVAPRLNIGPDNTGYGAVCSRRSYLAACGYPGVWLCDAITCGLVRGSRWGGFIAVRVVPVCAVEVGSAWSRRAWRATFRGTKRLAIAENIYKSHWESSLGLFAVDASWSRSTSLTSHI